MLIPAVHRVVHLTGEENWLSIEHRSVTVSDNQKVFITLLLSLQNNQTELQLSSLARSIVQVFETKVTQSLESESDVDMEVLIRKTITTLQEEQVDLDIISVIQLDSSVYLGATNGLVGIRREGVYGQILQSFGETITARGQLIDGDTLVLGSDIFTKSVTYKDVKSVLEQGAMQQFEPIVDQLTQLISVSPVSAGAAIISYTREQVIPRPGIAKPLSPTPTKEAYFAQPQTPTVGLRDLSAERKKKTVALAVAVMILLVFLGSIGWRWQQQKRQAEAERVASLLSPITQLMVLAEDQLAVNPLQARGYLFDAKTQIERLQAETAPEAKERAEIDELAESIKTKYAQVSGEREVVPELFFDLNLVKEGFSIDKLTLDETNLFALDPTNATVVWLDTDSKQSRVDASGGGLSGATLISSSQNQAFVYSDSGVYLIEDGQTAVLAPKQDEWQSVGGFGIFANRIYILDTAQGEIWRYQVNDETVVRQRWLAPGVTPEFTGVVDMRIDGDIWVLDKNGQVRQYTQGVSQGYSIQGLDVSMEDAVAIATTDEAVYVLERSKPRIVKFNREGVYQEQFVWPELSQASDMVSTEQGLLVSLGSKLYLFPH